MAVITVKIPNVVGESVVAGHAEELDAVSVRASLEVAVAQGTARNVGQAKHSDLEVTRYRDQASPKLAEACAAGENLGTVQVFLFRTQGEGVVPYMAWELADTYVSRIEVDTRDESGEAFTPHLVTDTSQQVAQTRPPSIYGFGSLLGSSSSPTIRLSPRSLIPTVRGGVGNQEVERLWLNPTTVKWTYTPYVNGIAGGVVEKAWNIKTGSPLA